MHTGSSAAAPCHQDVSAPHTGPCSAGYLLHNLGNTQTVEQSLLAEFLQTQQEAFLENGAECMSPAQPHRGRKGRQ